MIGVFLNLCKANAYVNYSILPCKLFSFGIQGTMHDWFPSYLANRQQFVQLHDSRSSNQIITCRVPQGSILGLLWLLLEKNDLN